MLIFYFRCWYEPRWIRVSIKRCGRVRFLLWRFPGYPSDLSIYGLPRGKVDSLLNYDPWFDTIFKCTGNLGLASRSRFGPLRPGANISLFCPWYSIRISGSSVVNWHRCVSWLIFNPFRHWFFDPTTACAYHVMLSFSPLLIICLQPSGTS